MSGKVGPNNSLEPPDSSSLIGDGHMPGEDEEAAADAPDDLVIEQKNFRIRLADT